MVFGGEVFPEWYWTPIFLFVYCSPAMVVVAGLVAFVLWRRTGWGLAARLGVCFAAALAVPAAFALVLGMKGGL